MKWGEALKYRRKLFRVRDPYAVRETDALFFQAVKENFEFQYQNCPAYRAICDARGLTAASLTGYDDIAKIPVLTTLLFKNHEIFSIEPRRVPVKATSSGTSGKRSRIAFELSGLWCGLKMVLKIVPLRKLLSLCPVHYIVLGYKPHKSNHTAVTKTALGATLFAPALSRTYALRYHDGAYTPDLEGVIRAVQKHSRSPFPMRFMGFPSYTYFMLKMMDERGIRVQLKKGSKILLGGGWKQFYTEQVDKEILYALAEKVLGIRDDNIVEFFGAVEHPILYCDCKNHHFHVPAYSRVLIRDVHTLEPVKNGEVGLVNLLTPMVKATPVLSVMTDDLGVLHDGEECGCGIASPYLEIIGRVGLKDIKTCAAGAAELLAGVKL